jgi:hypothetical protein
VPREVGKRGAILALLVKIARKSRCPPLSIHIYGTDVRQVGTSIRRRYELPVRLEEPILAFAHALASGG